MIPPASSFWHQLPRPFWILAPMEELTDAVFRRVVWERGAPDVFVTEFIRAEDMLSAGHRTAQRRSYPGDETPGVPLVVQFYGTNPEAFFKAAQAVAGRGFAGIDINMGCPAKRIRARGAGSGLIRTPDLAREIVLAAREGAGNFPVSIKTRSGYDAFMTEEWIGFLLELEPPLLTLHARTAVQMYGGKADWDQVALAVRLRNTMGKKTLIVGNGDLTSRAVGEDLAAETGCEGLMSGRGVLANPWFWSPAYQDLHSVPARERLEGAQRHLRLYRERYGSERNIHLMKKFIASALGGLPEWEQKKSGILSSSGGDELEARLAALRVD